MGVAIATVLRLSGYVSSFTIGRASNQFGQRIILIAMVAIVTACPFGFGWGGALPARLLMLFAAFYSFTTIDDLCGTFRRHDGICTPQRSSVEP